MTALIKSNLDASNLYSRLQKEGYKEVMHYIIYNGQFFPTWRDILYKKTNIIRLRNLFILRVTGIV